MDATGAQISRKDAELLGQKLSEQEEIPGDMLKELSGYQSELGHVLVVRCD